MSEIRTFTAKFKAKVVLELLSGHKSSAEICREYDLSESLLDNWKTLFLERGAQVFQANRPSGSEQARIAELERKAKQLTLQIEILKKAIKTIELQRGLSTEK